LDSTVLIGAKEQKKGGITPSTAVRIRFSDQAAQKEPIRGIEFSDRLSKQSESVS
jgi:hypothetical protein